MLKQVTLLTGVVCTTTHHTFKFLGSVERCWACRFTLADYFSARPDSFLIAIADAVLVDTVCGAAAHRHRARWSACGIGQSNWDAEWVDQKKPAPCGRRVLQAHSIGP